MPGKSPLRIFLSGDVMTGRGIDQILAHPSKPLIYKAKSRITITKQPT